MSVLTLCIIQVQKSAYVSMCKILIILITPKVTQTNVTYNFVPHVIYSVWMCTFAKTQQDHA